jgi:hypothetical protein
VGAIITLNCCCACFFVTLGLLRLESERQLEQEALSARAQSLPRASGGRLALYHAHEKAAGLHAARPGCNGAQSVGLMASASHSKY